MKKETTIQRQIMVAASKTGARVFRNNVGFDADRRVKYGLCNGSSDLIGWVPITITADMVGQTIARFLAIEVKTATGKPTLEQTRFLTAVNNNGGIGFVCRDPQSAKDLINGSKEKRNG